MQEIKRLFSLMMALVLLIAVAQAESFFQAVPTEAPAAESESFFPATPTTEYAPGYGAFTNVAPNSEDT